MMMEDIETIPDGARLKVTVQLAYGLHARPAARLTRAAQGFRSNIRILTETGEADAKSILDVLSLAVSRGTTCVIEAVGADAREAVGTVGIFLENEKG